MERGFTATTVRSGPSFLCLDEKLERPRAGPLYLRMPGIARLVVRALATGEGYALHEWAVMPNHVHVLFTPETSVPRILQGGKGTTARESNLVLHRTGRRFWQEESFDRLVRDVAEFETIRGYIRRNPVRAGLASTPETYPWSSAFAEVRS